MLELVGDFLGGRSVWWLELVEGSHHGPTRQGARPGGGRAQDPRGQVLAPPAVFSVPNILKYSRKKSYLNFKEFGELLFSGYFYIARIIQRTDRKYYFYFISTK